MGQGIVIAGTPVAVAIVNALLKMAEKEA